MKKRYSTRSHGLHSKYQKLVRLLKKSINNGRFVKYAQEKQDRLFRILNQYRSQLQKAGYILGTSLALMASPSTAYAQPAQLGTAFQVNTSTIEEYQLPVVAVDDDGDFAVVWNKYDTTSSYFSVYLQRYDNTGAAQGGEVTVAKNALSDYSNLPQIAMDEDGDFVVVWKGTDTAITSLYYDIYMQRYDKNGVAQGGETKVNTATLPHEYVHPAVAMDNDGDFAIAWSTYDTITGNYNLYLQRYDNTGTKQGGEAKVNTTSNYALNPDIAMDDDGDFVVVWQAYNNDTYNIHMQRYNNTGIKQGVETKVSDLNGYALYPSVAMDSHGDFVVTWTEEDTSFINYSVQLQRYNPAGIAQGNQIQVSPLSKQSLVADAAVGMDMSGNFVVIWNEYDGNSYDVYGQAYKSTGDTISTPFLVAANSNGEYLTSRGLAMEADGDFVVSWMQDKTNNSYDVHAQRYIGNLPTNTEIQGTSPYEFVIYPNPVMDQLFVETEQQGRLKIYNTLGQVLKESRVTERSMYIDVSSFPTGSYLIEVINDEGQRVIKKFIKQ